MPSCVKETSRTYISRPSPPYKAKNCKNLTMEGNDGQKYISFPRADGVHRWVRARKATTEEVKKIKQVRRVKKAGKPKKECRSDQYRNPNTGRCKKIAKVGLAQIPKVPKEKKTKLCPHGTYLQTGSCKKSVLRNKDLTSRITVRARSDDGHHGRERHSEYYDVSFSNPHFGKYSPIGNELFMFFDLETSLFFRPYFENEDLRRGEAPTIGDDSLDIQDVEKYLATHKVWIVDGIPGEYQA